MAKNPLLLHNWKTYGCTHIQNHMYTHTQRYMHWDNTKSLSLKKMCWHSREVIIFSYIESNGFLLLIKKIKIEFLFLQPVGKNCTVYEIAALLNQWDMIIIVKCGLQCLCIKRQGYTYTTLKFLTIQNIVSVFLDYTACLFAKYSTC